LRRGSGGVAALALYRLRRLTLVALGLAALNWPAVAADEKVGVAAEVNPDVTAQVPRGETRTLMVGNDVIRNEKIVTRDIGQAQLLFSDQSTLTVAKNSEVVIDEFVYNPQNDTGNLSANLTTGVFRYVGGKISKQQDVTFYTPTGSVSVRGGIALIQIQGNTVTAIFVHGDLMTVTTAGGSQTTKQSGTQISSNGSAPPSPPAPAPQQTIGGLTQQFLNAQASTGTQTVTVAAAALQDFLSNSGPTTSTVLTPNNSTSNANSLNLVQSATPAATTSVPSSTTPSSTSTTSTTSARNGQNLQMQDEMRRRDAEPTAPAVPANVMASLSANQAHAQEALAVQSIGAAINASSAPQLPRWAEADHPHGHGLYHGSTHAASRR
jgi:hypothetical protein